MTSAEEPVSHHASPVWPYMVTSTPAYLNTTTAGPIYLTMAGWTKPPSTTPRPLRMTRPPPYRRKPVSSGQRYPLYPSRRRPPSRRPSKKPAYRKPTVPQPSTTKEDLFTLPEREDLQLHQVCFGDTLEITCPKSHHAIVIVSAHFGRINYAREVSCWSENPFECGGRHEDVCGYADAFFLVNNTCTGHSECKMPVDGRLLAKIPNNSTCDVCQMYLNYAYFCRDPWLKKPRNCGYLAGQRQGMLTYHQGNYAYKNGYEVDLSFNTIERAMELVPKHDCKYSAGSQDEFPSSCPASDKHDDFFPPPLPKLCSTEWASMQTSEMKSWCPPLTCSAGCLPYLQIDLHGYFKVSGIVIQGRRKWDAWISEFRVEHSFDGKAFNALTRIFTGPKNARDLVLWHLNTYAFTARFIRIVVTRYHGYPAGHIDVIRCKYCRFCFVLFIFLFIHSFN